MNRRILIIAALFSSIILILFNNCGKFSEIESTTLGQKILEKTISQHDEVKVALMGDTDIHDKFSQALELAKREGSQVMMINGDFAYAEDGYSNIEIVEEWNSRIERSIDFNQISVIGSIGNHDIDKKDQLGHNGEMLSRYINYFQFFRNNSNGLNQKCTGQSQIRTDKDTILMNEVCTFGNVSIVASAIGITEVFSDTFYENELQKKLNQAPSTNWKMAGYHYTLKSMNMAGKNDETTHKFFDIIREQGAIGVQAHTHTAMASCPISTQFKEGNPVRCLSNFENNTDKRFIEPGTGIFLDSSVSGRDVRDKKGCSNEGSSQCDHLYDYISYDGYHKKNGTARNIGSRDGVMFIDFNKNGDPSQAYVYFKNLDGNVIFDFTITRQIATAPIGDIQGDENTVPPSSDGPLKNIDNGQYREVANGRVLTKVSNSLACRPTTLYNIQTNKEIYDKLSSLYNKDACVNRNTANQQDDTPTPTPDPNTTDPVDTSSGSSLINIDNGQYREVINGRVLTKVSNTLACKPTTLYNIQTNKEIYDKLSSLYNKEACANRSTDNQQDSSTPTPTQPTDNSNATPLINIDNSQYREVANGRVLVKVSNSLACRPVVIENVVTNKNIYEQLSAAYNKEGCNSFYAHDQIPSSDGSQELKNTDDLKDIDSGHYWEEKNGRVLTKVSGALSCRPNSPYNVKLNKTIYDKLSKAYSKTACTNVSGHK